MTMKKTESKSKKAATPETSQVDEITINKEGRAVFTAPPEETEREYTVTYSDEVAWESHRSNSCQVFAEDIADAVILGVETLQMESLIDVDHSKIRVIGVMEYQEKK